MRRRAGAARRAAWVLPPSALLLCCAQRLWEPLSRRLSPWRSGWAPRRAGGELAFALPRRTAATGAILGAVAGGEVAALAEQGPAGAEAEPQRFSQVIAETLLDDWKIRDYQAMRDDMARTSKFEAAIKRRLQGTEGKATVVDIGTGSFALLAIMAARAGAKKVYAIEKNKKAAERAQETVQMAGLQDKIQIIEGDSMEVALPERVDLVVSELIGSIATQEGVEPIIRDAARRFLKPRAEGDGRPQMIPARCQTCVAPVDYKDHEWYQWKKGVQSRGQAEPGSLRPLRLPSETQDIVFLAQPQLLEDFDYSRAAESERTEARTVDFLVGGGEAAGRRRFSGFALWTRVVVDEAQEDVIEVAGQKSHWAYVVALMSERPVPLAAGPVRIRLRSSADYAALPVRYTLDAELAPAAVSA